MGTMEDFSNIDPIEWCVKEDRIKEVQHLCGTCTIINCLHSPAYHLTKRFWAEYTEERKRIEFIQELNKDEIPPEVEREGFVRA